MDSTQPTTSPAMPIYQHIHENFRHIAGLSDEKRLEFIDAPRWIGYPSANQTLEIMQGLMNKVKQPRMPNLLLIGESNNGKTTVLKQFNKRFGDPYIENEVDMVLPVVMIQAPPSPNEKDLYLSLLQRFTALPYKASDPASALRYQVVHAFRESRVKILIIDEIHSVLTGTPRQQRLIMNCLKFLCNELEIPIVAAGTPDAVRVLHTDSQHASRFDVKQLEIWKNDLDFKRMVGSFERTLPLKQPSHLIEPEKLNLIHTISDGRIGNVKRLLNECAIEAIRHKEESISLAMIKEKSWLRPTKGLRQII